MHTRTITSPSNPPVLLSDVKAYLRIDSNDEDSLLTMLTNAATSWVEAYLGVSLITQTRKTTLNQWADGQIAGFTLNPSYLHIPYPPLQSITSITYKDADGVTQTVASGTYEAHTHEMPGYVYAEDGFPSVGTYPDPIAITYVAGFGSDYTSIPDTIRVSILQLTSDYYENRTPVGTASDGVERLLNVNGYGSYRI